MVNADGQKVTADTGAPVAWVDVEHEQMTNGSTVGGHADTHEALTNRQGSRAPGEQKLIELLAVPLHRGALRCLVHVMAKLGVVAVPSVDDEAIFRELYRGLRRFAAVVGPIEVEPDDLVHDALVRVLAKTSLSELANPGAYLRTTIVRLASNRRREMGRRRRNLSRLVLSESAVDDYPSDLSALDELTPSDRAIVFLTVIEGMPTADVGAILGWSDGKVRMRKHRALQRLRDLEERNDA